MSKDQRFLLFSVFGISLAFVDSGAKGSSGDSGGDSGTKNQRVHKWESEGLFLTKFRKLELSATW